MGFMLGGDWFSLYGPDTQHAFGHIGFTNVICWADPDRRVAAALLTSGKPFLYPELYYLFDVLRQIGLACPRSVADAGDRGATRRCPPRLAARVACGYAPRMTIRLASLQGRAQLVHGDRLLDLERASGGRFAADPMAALAAWDALRDWGGGLAADRFDGSADRMRFDAPVPRPTKVFAIGLNYREPCRGGRARRSRRRRWCSRSFRTAWSGPHADVPLASGFVDYEAELVVVIGRACQGGRRRAGARGGRGLLRRPGHLGPQAPVQRQAAAVLASASRSTASGRSGPPWSRSTGCAIRTTWRSPARSSGERLQHARTTDMIFAVPELVAYLSRYCTLEPGDLIFTGTPAGVGSVRNPRRYLKPGEVIRTEIEGIGELVNACVARADPCDPPQSTAG